MPNVHIFIFLTLPLFNNISSSLFTHSVHDENVKKSLKIVNFSGLLELYNSLNL